MKVQVKINNELSVESDSDATEPKIHLTIGEKKVSLDKIEASRLKETLYFMVES